MSHAITDSELIALHREADRAARRAVRKLGLPAHDYDDLLQEILFDLISRLRWFDPSRGTLGAFAGTVVRNKGKELTKDVYSERQMFRQWDPQIHPTAAENGIYWSALTTSPEGIERRLDLTRAVGALPALDRLLCVELAGSTPAEVARSGRFSRAGLYRRLKSIRQRLQAEGIS